MKRLDRPGLAVLLLALGMLLLAGAFLGLRLMSPSDGARLKAGGGAWQTDGVVVVPLQNQPDGLKEDDVVVAVDGRGLETWAQSLFDAGADRPKWAFGQSVTYRVIRDGEPQDVPVTLGSYPLDAVLKRDWAQTLAVLVILLVAGLAFYKRPYERATQVLFLFAAAVVGSNVYLVGLHIVIDIVGGLGFWLHMAITHGIYPLQYAALLHFSLVFPKPRPVLSRRRWLIPAVYAAPYAYLVVYTLASRSGATNTLAWIGRIEGAVGGVEVVYLALILAAAIFSYRTARDPVSRYQVRWVLSAFFIAGVPFLAFGILPEAILGAPLVSYNVLGLVGLLIPVAIAVAILRYRLFDIDLVISRTLVYGTLTAGVVSVYVLVVGAAGLVFQTSSALASLLLTAVVAAVLFRPLRAGLQRRVDRLMPVKGQRPPGISRRKTASRAQTGEDRVADPGATSRALASGRWLRVARGVWWIAVAIAVLVFIVSIPGYTLFLGENPPQFVISIGPGPSSAFAVNSLQALVAAIAVVVSLSLAAVLYRRKQDDPMALFVSFYMLAYGIVLAGPLEVLEALWHDTPQVVMTAQAIFWSAPTMLLLFLFPSGRFVPRWTRWLLPVSILAALLCLPLWAYPSVPESLDPLLQDVVLAVFVGLYVAGVYAQIYRYRHVSGPVERRQAKWAVFGLVAWLMTQVLLMAVWIFWLGIPSDEPLPWWVPASQVIYSISLNLLPASMGIALLRHRLWDVDILISRALVYGALTALVIALYVLVVGSFGALFRSSGSLLVGLLATGLAAVLFQPLRERLQRGVNRLMYGERDDPYTVLSRLGQRLEATLAPGAGLQTIVETVAQALKLPFVAIALKQGEGFRTASSFGLPVDDPFILPLTYQGEVIGQLSCARRDPGEEFTRADRRLLENIARQAGAVAHTVRLAADLQRSRVRLVTAREEERRRLRRDLHDGLGPQLASLILKSDAAHNLLRHDPDAAAALLVELKTQTQAAITDIRRLVYNLRPPPLDELGLVAALRAHAAANDTADDLHVSVEAPESVPPLPAAVEVAAYRIALEALTNVARHANARRCVLRLTLDHALQLEISDDGTGLPQGYHAGVGLTSMRERAEELGGTCEIGLAPGGGTRVLARLPLPPAEK